MPTASAILRFALTTALLADVSASSRETLSCPCGSTGTNNTFHISVRAEACQTWSRCLKCKDEVDYCLECPVGFYGPTCSQISCPALGPVPNADRINVEDGPTDRPGHSTEFVFHDGFELHGSSTLICLESGTWSGQPPFCSRVARPNIIRRVRNTDLNACPDPGVPPNGVRTVVRPSNSPPFPRGSHLKFSCEKDFRLEGWGSITCLSGGKWSSPLPACSPLYLPSEEDPAELMVLFKPIEQKPKEDVRCSNPGPYFNGQITVMKTVYLQPDESIMKYLIKEDPVVRTPDEDHYPQDTWLQYLCDPGYILSHERFLHCRDTGLWSRKPPICVQDCGRLLKSKEETVDSVVPWMVGLASQPNESPHLACGGVLLNDRTVLTVASCFLGNETFKLLFGKYRSRPEDSDDGVLQRTDFTVEIHPNFNYSTRTADIALVHFSPAITFSTRIMPICLPTNKTGIRNLSRGRGGYVASWGLTRDLKALNSYLMFRHRVVLPHSCRRDYERNNRTLPRDPKTFCAEPSEAQVNICEADGGSPLLFFGYSSDKVHSMEGLASVGLSSSCGRLRRYTAFTQVLPYVPWIMENMP